MADLSNTTSADQPNPADQAKAATFFDQLTKGTKAPDARKAAKAAAQAAVDARRAAKGLPVYAPGTKAPKAAESASAPATPRAPAVRTDDAALYTVAPGYLEKAMGMRYEHAALGATLGQFGREDFVAVLAATMATPEYAALQPKADLRTEREARIVFQDLKRAGVFTVAA